MLLTILTSAIVSLIVSWLVVWTEFRDLDSYVQDVTEELKEIISQMEEG